MIIYGWGTKNNPLGVTDLIHCDRCGNTGPWLIYQAKKQFKLYWIPVAQWNKRIVAECSTCPNAYIIPPEKLDEVLSQGNESNETRFLKVAAAILKSVAKVGGIHSSEWKEATKYLVDAGDGSISEKEADQLLREATANDINPHLFEERDLYALLALAISVAFADGTISAEEIKALETLAIKLLLPKEMVRVLIDRLTEEKDTSGNYTSKEATNAYNVLGLKPGASVAEIRTAYRALMKKHHPDLAEPSKRDEATRISSEIVAAYDFLIGRVNGSKNSNSTKSNPENTTYRNATRSSSTPPSRPKKNLCTSCERRLKGTEKFCMFCGTKI